MSTPSNTPGRLDSAPDRAPGASSARARLAVAIVNYRTAELTCEAVESARAGCDPMRDRILVVDSDSGDGSVERLRIEATARGWGEQVRIIEAPRNGGFSYGNNVALEAQPADFHLLLNSDARVEPGAIDALLEAAAAHPDAGILGPRIVDEAGIRQESAFRDRTPLTELLESLDLSWLRSLLARHDPLMPAPTTPTEVDWLSFACALVRGEVVERIGGLDDAYFLYYDDADYCRRAREAGFGVLHWPAARAVHNEGSSGSVPSARSLGRRPPLYFYASRARYLAKFYGRPGLWAANLLRMIGRPIAWLRAALGRGRPTFAHGEWHDLWRGALDPLHFTADPANSPGPSEVRAPPARSQDER